MSPSTVALSEASSRLLHDLAEQTGQPAIAILDQALVEYSRTRSLEDRLVPEASPEAEILDDPGRIRLPSRNVQAVAARVIPVGRRLPRIGEAEE